MKHKINDSPQMPPEFIMNKLYSRCIYPIPIPTCLAFEIYIKEDIKRDEGGYDSMLRNKKKLFHLLYYS